MDIIQVLPEKTAQLIAAGEVVENPASVVKELVENSIDAGAKSIRVEIQNGGISLIKVSDNGKGMSKNDAKNCFLRHATSKVRTPADIFKLMTLGFRGEALASVAAVSKIRLTTAQEASEEGISVCVEGGKITETTPIGCNKGTIIAVKDLFYNTPARKKFLKSERSEAGAIASLIDRLCLSHPDISFKYINNGKEELFTPGDGELKSAIMAVWGTQSASQVLEVKAAGEISITGYISKPLFSKGTRQMQLFYINRRMVQSRMLSAALEDAYKGSIMTGKFPSCVLNVDIDASLVDVNVHPSKSIVKFSDEKLIFSALRRAVSVALLSEKQQYTATIEEKPKPKEEVSEKQVEAVIAGFVEKEAVQGVLKNFEQPKPEKVVVESKPVIIKPEPKVTVTEERKPIPKFEDLTLTFNDIAKKEVDDKGREVLVIKKEDIPPMVTIPQFTVKEEKEEEVELVPETVQYIGEVLKAYIIAQANDEVYIIDKHAAHERLIYENLKKNADGPVSQPLLLSLNIDLDKSDKNILLENADLLCRSGFEIEDMWGNSVSVKAIPQILADDDIESVLSDIAESLKSGKNKVDLDKFDRILEITSCKAAIKAGQKNAPEELQKLIDNLFAIPDIKYCPHGRPIIYTLTQKDFEKFFKRIV